ncbi:MAG: PAS domain-containing protein [Spirochaetes bacterium]|nr:PAS domain-containing protein [Spirochaetota bacterium]
MAKIAPNSAALIQENQELRQRLADLEKKAAEHEEITRELEQRYDFEKLVSSISTRFINLQNGDIDRGIHQALRWIGEFFGADHSYLYQFIGPSDRMAIFKQWFASGEGAPLRSPPISLDDDPAFAATIRSGRIVHIPDVRLAARARGRKIKRRLAAPRGIRSTVKVPMLCQGRLRGFFGFDAIRTPFAWSPKLLSLLQMVGEIFWLALERKKAGEDLQTEQFYLATIMDNEVDRVYFKDVKSRFTRVNRALAARHGFANPEEAIGKTDFDSFTSEHARQSHRDEQRIMRTGKPMVNEIEKETMPGGAVTWAQSSKIALRDATGRVVGIFGISRDVTDLVRARAEIENERNLLRTLVDNLPDYVYAKDRQGRYLLNNKAHLRLLGKSRTQQEVLGRNDFEYFPREHAQKYRDDENAILRTGTPILDRVEPVIDERGRSQWFSSTKVLLKDARGEATGTLGISRNVTERIKAEGLIKESVRKLEKTLQAMIYTMARIVETRDPYTAGHQQRVAELARAIAKRMGLGDEQVYYTHLSAVVHDIGKIYVPAEILNRPGKLSDLEYRLIKSHTQLGYDILKTIDFPYPIADIVVQHHEHLDGSGYPAGLKDGRIRLEARIITVADVVEAMANHRPYRAALGIDLALREVQAGKGTRYDPAVVSACRKVFRQDKFRFT